MAPRPLHGSAQAFEVQLDALIDRWSGMYPPARWHRAAGMTPACQRRSLDHGREASVGRRHCPAGSAPRSSEALAPDDGRRTGPVVTLGGDRSAGGATVQVVEPARP